MYNSRRSFLRNAATTIVSGSALMRSFGSLSALAQNASSGSDYKAMVCIYLYGGNDGNNLLIPLDLQSLAMYAKARGSLALTPNSLLPIGSGAYGVHPSMPQAQGLYNQGNLAFVANMGTLIAPTTKAAMLTKSVQEPGDLYSHPSQTTLMQTGLQAPSSVNGWGGGIAEALAGSYQGITPMCTSFYGANPFVNGVTTPGYIAQGGDGRLFCSMGDLCSARVQGNAAMLSLPELNPLVNADQHIVKQMIDLNSKFGSIVSQAPSLKTSFPPGFASAFREVIAVIQQRQALNANRHIFFLGLGGFDFHGGQLPGQAFLLSQLDAGLATFAQALQEIGMFNNVTTFTLSDFGRTLQSNGNGSDHGWGNHHMVMGGSVQGSQIVGTYPTLDPGGPDDAGDNSGRWIPTTSVEHLGAALALWFGVPPDALRTVFPNLFNFLPPQSVSSAGIFTGSSPLPIFGRA